MNHKYRLSAVVFLLTIGYSASGAVAQCQQFPTYELWKTLTHERAKSYIERKLKGNWDPYIAHLQKQLKDIDKIIAHGKGARLKHKGEMIVLKGGKLAEYRRVSQARLDVVQCLADEAHAVKFDQFATAAGGNDDDELPVTEVRNVAMIGGAAQRLKVEVSASCSDGVSKFKIKNQGSAWPKASAISIFRVDGAQKYTVSGRRMRLKKGQVASFTVKKSGNPSGNLGIFIEPAWYNRSFAYDATLTCR